jgi:hypothetical protein
MPIKLSNVANALVLLTLTLAVLGGVFFGLFSCGGYIWHIQVYWAIALIFILGSMILKNKILNSMLSKILFPIFYLALFFISQSVAATFYPSAPENLSEFISNLFISLEYGPCP